ncbi:MAG: hypothetical protein ACI4LA_08115 [Emergencia sp.]
MQENRTKRIDIKWVVIVCLTGFLCISLFYRPESEPFDQRDVIGTYMAGSPEAGSVCYAVFEEGDVVCCYVPFGEKHMGTYERDEENVYALYFGEEKEKTYAVFVEGYVYLCSGDGVMKYKKLGNVPTYVETD